MRFLNLLAILSLLALPALAESHLPNKPVTASGTYILDKTHASLTFTIKHLGFSNYTGRFNDLDAELTFDAKNPDKSTLTASLNPASVDTNNTELENKIRGEYYFNTSKFPLVSFVSKSIKLRDKKSGTLTGDLTMLGITKPVTLNVTINQIGHNTYANKDEIGISATGTLKRSEWGIKTLIPQVSDEVKIMIEAEFMKQK